MTDDVDGATSLMQARLKLLKAKKAYEDLQNARAGTVAKASVAKASVAKAYVAKASVAEASEAKAASKTVANVKGSVKRSVKRGRSPSVSSQDSLASATPNKKQLTVLLNLLWIQCRPHDEAL